MPQGRANSRWFSLSNRGVPIGRLLGSGRVLVKQIEQALARRKATVHYDSRTARIYVEAKYSSDLDQVETIIRNRIRAVKAPRSNATSWNAGYTNPAAKAQPNKTSGAKVVVIKTKGWGLKVPTACKVATQAIQRFTATKVKTAPKAKKAFTKTVDEATPTLPGSASSESDDTMSVTDKAQSEVSSSATSRATETSQDPTLDFGGVKKQRRRRAKKSMAVAVTGGFTWSTSQQVSQKKKPVQKAKKAKALPAHVRVQKSKAKVTVHKPLVPRQQTTKPKPAAQKASESWSTVPVKRTGDKKKQQQKQPQAAKKTPTRQVATVNSFSLLNKPKGPAMRAKKKAEKQQVEQAWKPTKVAIHGWVMPEATLVPAKRRSQDRRKEAQAAKKFYKGTSQKTWKPEEQQKQKPQPKPEEKAPEEDPPVQEDQWEQLPSKKTRTVEEAQDAEQWVTMKKKVKLGKLSKKPKLEGLAAQFATKPSEAVLTFSWDVSHLFKGSHDLHFVRIQQLCLHTFNVKGGKVVITRRRNRNNAEIFVDVRNHRGSSVATTKVGRAMRNMAIGLLRSRLEKLKFDGEFRHGMMKEETPTSELLKLGKEPKKAEKCAKKKSGKTPIWERRLQKDLHELQCNEFPNIAVHLPNHEDLLNWHVNIRAADGPMKKSVLHLIMQFSERYPFEAPKVRVCTAMPNHPNVFGEWLCLDILKEAQRDHKWRGWTPAYSASSLLMQLQSFLCAESVTQGDHYSKGSKTTKLKNYETTKTFRKANKKFVCPCGHTGAGRKRDVCIPAFDVPLSKVEVVDNSLPKSKSPMTDETTVAVHQDHQGDRVIWRTILEFLPTDSLLRATKAFVELDHLAARWNLCEARERRCFFTKKDSLEAILGFGFLREATEDNYPEAITTDGNYISVEAWTQYGVNHGVYGRGFDGEDVYNHFLPLAIHAKHFAKAKEHIDEAIRVISGKASPSPAQKLDTLCDFMIKVLVQTLKTSSGKATSAGMSRMAKCEASIQTFCSLHHLLLSYCRAEPKIRSVALQRLKLALRAGGMNKSVCGNLGYLMMYQTVVDSSEVSWDQLKTRLVCESFLRSHKWNEECHDLTMTDAKRVDATFHNRTTATRIMLFQHLFVEELCRKPGRSWLETLQNYDRHCGSPGRGVLPTLHEKLQEILKMDSWKFYFEYLSIPKPPSMEKMATFLKVTLAKSRVLRYHSSRERRLFDILADCKRTGKGMWDLWLPKSYSPEKSGLQQKMEKWPRQYAMMSRRTRSFVPTEWVEESVWIRKGSYDGWPTWEEQKPNGGRVLFRWNGSWYGAKEISSAAEETFKAAGRRNAPNFADATPPHSRGTFTDPDGVYECKFAPRMAKSTFGM